MAQATPAPFSHFGYPTMEPGYRETSLFHARIHPFDTEYLLDASLWNDQLPELADENALTALAEHHQRFCRDNWCLGLFRRMEGGVGANDGSLKALHRVQEGINEADSFFTYLQARESQVGELERIPWDVEGEFYGATGVSLGFQMAPSRRQRVHIEGRYLRGDMYNRLRMDGAIHFDEAGTPFFDVQSDQVFTDRDLIVGREAETTRRRWYDNHGEYLNPDGTGGAIDVAYAYETKTGGIEAGVHNLWGTILWRDVPRFTLCADDFEGDCPVEGSGGATFTGRHTIASRVRQTLPRTWFAHGHLRIEKGRIGARLVDNERFLTPYLYASRETGRRSVSIGIEPLSPQVVVGYHGPVFAVVLSNTLSGLDNHRGAHFSMRLQHRF